MLGAMAVAKQATAKPTAKSTAAKRATAQASSRNAKTVVKAAAPKTPKKATSFPGVVYGAGLKDTLSVRELLDRFARGEKFEAVGSILVQTRMGTDVPMRVTGKKAASIAERAGITTPLGNLKRRYR